MFSAIRGNEQIVRPVCMPSVSDDLKRCLDTLIAGFDGVVSQLDVSPVAISFAFPGPADYKNGVIGGNIPNFRLSVTEWLSVHSYNTTIMFRYLWKMTGTCSLMERRCQECCLK